MLRWDGEDDREDSWHEVHVEEKGATIDPLLQDVLKD